MNSTHHRSVTASVQGVEIVCVGVDYYPCEIDPPAPAIAAWTKVLIGGVEVQALFAGDLANQLEDALVEQLEEA